LEVRPYHVSQRRFTLARGWLLSGYFRVAAANLVAIPLAAIAQQGIEAEAGLCLRFGV